MRSDHLGQIILNEIDICGLYLQDPSRNFDHLLVESDVRIDKSVDIENPPKLTYYQETTETVEEFDQRMQSSWRMPEEYKNLDIALWLLNQCENDAQRQRVGEELILYLERDLFPLLQYLKYLVDTLRQNNIVWGVGRGSSVASYVLFLIGIHRIDSMYWDLPIDEFLR